MTMIVCACCYEIEASCQLYDTGPPLGYLYLCDDCVKGCPVSGCKREKKP